jgi:hypothetical protein
VSAHDYDIIRRPRPALRVGAATVFALGCLYVLTLPRAHMITDSYQWIEAVRSAEWSELFHPHHLVYNAVAWFLTLPIVESGVPVWTAVQLLSVLGGMTAAAAFYAVAVRTTGSLALSVLGTVLYGTAFATWIFAVDVEVYIFAVAALLWAFFLLLRAADHPRWSRFLLVGCVAGLGGLFHQTAVFFLVAGVLGAWMDDASRRRRAGRTLALLAGFGLVAGIPYLLVGTLVVGAETPGAFWRWMTLHAGYGYYGGLRWTTPLRVLVGFGRALIYGAPVLDALRGEPDGLAPVVLGQMLAMGVLTGSGFILLSRLGRAFQPDGSPRRRRMGQASLLALGWFLAAALFSAYYEPQNVEWWCLPLAPAAVLIVQAAACVRPWRGILLLALWAAAQLSANLWGDILPRRDPMYDPHYAAAMKLREEAGEEGLVVAPAVVTGRLAPPAFPIQIAVRTHGNRLAPALRELAAAVRYSARSAEPVAVLEGSVAPWVERYQPGVREVAETLRHAAERHGEAAGTVRLPWERTDRFGHPAPWRRMRILRIPPGRASAFAEDLDRLAEVLEAARAVRSAEPSGGGEAPGTGREAGE